MSEEGKDSVSNEAKKVIKLKDGRDWEVNTAYEGNNLDFIRLLPDNCIDSVVTDPPYGLKFMGKKWDYEIPKVELWEEVLRVLKPGGYLLSFAGTRTQHRMACNIEDAGFEIRDMIAWVYGSGMPKSHNISKTMSKSEELEEEAQLWDGWGTALKPALEPITVARKPLSEKTIVKNVLRWGTGGINIGNCKIEYSPENPPIPQLAQGKTNVNSKKTMYDGQSMTKSVTKATIGGSLDGRWPANLIHDGSEEVVKLFPETVKQAKCKSDNKSGWQSSYVGGKVKAPKERTLHLDEKNNSASRFFYCAKASKKDRGENNIHPTVKPTELVKYLIRLVTVKDGICLDPYLGSFTTAVACNEEEINWIGAELPEEQDGSFSMGYQRYASRIGKEK